MGAIKKNDIKPWLKKSWCLTTIDGEFLARMEDVLDLYEKPYQEQYPVVCLDERPCQLLGEVFAPLPCTSGSVRKEDYHYTRNGTCTVFVAVEPLKGVRLYRVSKQRTKQDYAKFMRQLSRRYPRAKAIHLVQDNLNTHTIGAFYETFAAPVAQALAKRFIFHPTPKKASWLNMAEIELSALSKECLDRRIATIALLTKEVNAFEAQRNKLKKLITWSFTTDIARVKLHTRYQNVLYNKLK